MRIIETFENNCMSLSCRGEMKLDENNRVIYSSYKGYPRSNGRDRWISFYKNAKKGDEITEDRINNILSFDGHDNIVSCINANI